MKSRGLTKRANRRARKFKEQLEAGKLETQSIEEPKCSLSANKEINQQEEPERITKTDKGHVKEKATIKLAPSVINGTFVVWLECLIYICRE